jgi:protein-S-isoprenylcysteine O-methyltransferase Ste14
MDLRNVVVTVLYIVFIRQFWVAGSTFTIIRSEGPALQRLLIPLSMFVLAYLSRSISPNVWSVVAGCIVAALALALLEWARLCVQGKFFSYLFSNDVPEFLWTAGPYAYIRNPFYSSYLLAYASAAIMLPSLAMLILFVGMALFYSAAARKEERKFESSALASEYEAYKQRTGRFIPKFRS